MAPWVTLVAASSGSERVVGGVSEHASPLGEAGDQIELEADEAFGRREARAESVGWLILILLVACALLGALGTGPLSSGRAASASGSLALEYQRVTHRAADDTLALEVERTAQGAEPLIVSLGGDWLEALDLRGITPEPAEQAGTPEGLELTIPMKGSGRVRIVLSVRTAAVGLTRGHVRVEGEEITFAQLVLP